MSKIQLRVSYEIRRMRNHYLGVNETKFKNWGAHLWFPLAVCKSFSLRCPFCLFFFGITKRLDPWLLNLQYSVLFELQVQSLFVILLCTYHYTASKNFRNINLKYIRWRVIYGVYTFFYLLLYHFNFFQKLRG